MSEMDVQYDVFLSHRSVNKPWVETLANNLKACGLNPFFDTWSLIPGHSLPRQLHEGIQQSRKAVIIATQEAVESGWVGEEYDALISRRTNQPGFLIPLTFAGEVPDFPFLQNVLTIDFSDPSADSYRMALHRLLCALRDESPGDTINLPAGIQIPEAISSDPTQAGSAILSGGEAACLDQLLNNANNMQLLLAQKGMDRSAMQKAILAKGEAAQGKAHCLHASPLTNSKADSAKYFRWMGRKLKLDEAIADADDLRFALEDRIEQQGSLLLLITRFDDGPDGPRRELADMLRALCEDLGDAVRVIFCGGQALAGLRYAGNMLSPLQNAEVVYWPESNEEELMQAFALPQQQARLFLDLSGGHPRLLRMLIDQHAGKPDQATAELEKTMLDYALRNGFFRAYDESGAELQTILEKNPVAAHDYWPADTLLRQLFWDNLLTRQSHHFIWRCPILQQCGQQVLKP